MKKAKLLSLIICSFLLVVTGFFFVGCKGVDYSDKSLEAYVNGEKVQNVTMSVGAVLPIEFVIENYESKMSGELNVTLPPDDQCVTMTKSYRDNGVTTVLLTATQGGKTTINATSIEGLLSCSVSVTVTEYASSISNSDSNLYLTETTTLQPDANDFVFENGIMRNLRFAFYGRANDEQSQIGLTDLPQDGGQYLYFNSVRLAPSSSNDGNLYLIFDLGNGQYRTIQNAAVAPDENKAMQWINATPLENGTFVLTGGNPMPVNLGDKFTFMAIHENETEQPVTVLRDFYVLKDLNFDNFTYSYSYDGDDQTYPLADSEDKGIYLVQNDEKGLQDYHKLSLVVTVPSASDLLVLDRTLQEVNGLKIANITCEKEGGTPDYAEQSRTYVYSITSDVSTTLSTNLVFSLYYDGFKDGGETVSATLSIPFHVLSRPTAITVNDVMPEDSEEHVYKFYDYYDESTNLNTGWQKFALKVNPLDASKSRYVITFNPQQVMMRYQGHYYRAIDDSQTMSVTLSDITEPIEFRGVAGDNALGDGSINIALFYTILTEQSIDYTIFYNVAEGASNIAVDQENISYLREAVYMSLGTTQEFAGFYADADFEDAVVTFVPSESDGASRDVARFEFLGTQQVGDKYYIRLSATANAVGNGQYKLTLDNGVTLFFRVEVIETLERVDALVQGDSGVSYVVSGETEDDIARATIYIRNDNDSQGATFGKQAKVFVYANGKLYSTAITSKQTPIMSGSGFQASEEVVPGQNMVVTIETLSLSNGSLLYTIVGQRVENFKHISATKQIQIDVVSYSEIEELYVYKTHDGEGKYPLDRHYLASNILVYYGTDLASKNSATFALSPRYAGYLFFDASTGSQDYGDLSNYRAEFFDPSNPIFVTWRINSQNYVYDPSGDNLFTIERYGTFNTQTMTFVATHEFSKLQVTATVHQLGKSFSKSFYISSKRFSDVQSLSKQGLEDDEIVFSASKRSANFYVHVNPSDATDPSINYLFQKPRVDEGEVDIFGDDGIKINKIADGLFEVSLTISQEFISNPLSSQDKEFVGNLIIASSSWIAGNTVGNKIDDCVQVTIRFANGTWSSPYLIETAQDLLRINDMPDKHFVLASTIDLSMLSEKDLSDNLPLCKDAPNGFVGSLRGQNEYAVVKGIEVKYGNTDGTSGNFYGLFSHIGANAVIEGIKFVGKIDVSVQAQSAISTHVGLLAGWNEGQIINVGVELSGDCTVNFKSVDSHSRVYVGGVVGRNTGLIIQDYGDYLQTKLDGVEGYAIEGKYAGQTPRILLYGGKSKLTVVSEGDNESATVYVGGVSGYNSTGTETNQFYQYDRKSALAQTDVEENAQKTLTFATGSIIKIDEQRLQAFGYTNYLAYLDIVTSGNKNFVGMISGYSQSAITGYASITRAYNNNLTANTYNLSGDRQFGAGKGIIVGGSIVDQSLQDVDITIESFEQYIGGVVGQISLTDWKNFTGITSRVSVLGSKYVGALAGEINSNGNAPGSTGNSFPVFALQAVDSGKKGEYAAMLCRVSAKVDSFSENYWSWYKATTDVNKIAFARSDSELNLFGGEEENRNSIKSYVLRQRADEYETNLAADKYYGDFVVIKRVDGVSSLYRLTTDPDAEPETDPNAVWEFEKDSQALSASPSANFSPFVDESGEQSSDMFFMFRFTSNGFVYEEEGQDVATSQNYLNTYFNTINPGTQLYPLQIPDGMVLSSLTPGIVSIDQSGRMTVLQTGIAKVQISSILDQNNLKVFNLYVVDYFNPSKDISVLYSTNSSGAAPLERYTILLKGEGSTNLYIIPSNETAGFDHISNARVTGGVLQNNGINIRLATNHDVTANIQIFMPGSDKPIYDSDKTLFEEDDNPEDEIPPSVMPAPMSVEINGQTITLRRNDQTKEYDSEKVDETSYKIVVNPILRAQGQTQDEVKTYTSFVNKKLENLELNYRKGARAIQRLSYGTVSLHTENSVLETIRVTSGYDPKLFAGIEQNPSYVITRKGGQNRSAFFSTYENVVVENPDEIFKVDFKSCSTTQVDSSDYYYYDFITEITFNKASKLWTNHDEEIYGLYTITFYAKSDNSKFCSIDINLERTTVENIVIDNYKSLSTLSDFADTTHVAVPGNFGLLKLTLTPTDADFDYITIENDVIADQEGNGFANFSLVALLKDKGDTFKFEETSIVGQSTGRGVRFALQDIIDAYSKEEYCDYEGIIYLRYSIGTHNVAENGSAKFNVFVHTAGEKGPVYPITLQLRLEFHAFADIVGKTPAVDNDESAFHATYLVARGLRYEISLDNIWGYTLADLTLSTSNESLAQIVNENGRYYVQITDDDIVYSEGCTFVNIQVYAHQKIGEIDRENTSTTRLRILDYVVNYQTAQQQNPDIINRMEEGVINVRIGSKQSLRVDMTDFVEFDQNSSLSLARVNQFFDDMTRSNDATWTLYTNLISDYISSGRTISIQDGEYQSTYAVGVNENFDNLYLYVQGLDLVPRKTHRYANPFYLFKYSGSFAISGGRYIACASDFNGAQTIETEFALNVYQATDENNIVPIDDYADLMAMQPGENYILTSDIEIPREDQENPFSPITADFSSLDGNDYSIIFRGNYDFGDSNALGLFSTVSENTIIKNLRVLLKGDTTFVSSASNVFDAGLLCAENLGTITNCEVVSQSDENTGRKFVFSISNTYVDNQSYVGGLVGRNNGFITNSRSQVYISTNFSTAGFVGYNSGHIASSYFKSGRVDMRRAGHSAAGFAVFNSGVIMTSYVSGDVDRNYIFSRDRQNILSSAATAAGFVHSNSVNGQISDCYSNIQVSGSSSMAGFVYANAGSVKNSFSLSVVDSTSGLSGGFAYTDIIDDPSQQGSFENCYFFRNSAADMTADENGIVAGYSDTGTINISLNQTEFVGVSPLNRLGFENGSTESQESQKFEDLFATYAYYDLTSVDKNAGVWFYSTGETSDLFGTDAIFAGGRLELVSANIIAKSRRNLSRERTIENDDGQIQYEYDYDLDYPALGTAHNPYIIRSPHDLETLMREQITSNGINTNDYRIVNDIRYTDMTASGLNDITFCGTLEGNGAKISGIVMNSAAHLSSAGFLAQIGRNANSIGVVMNLTIAPRQDITFNNTTTVGALAGVLDYGYLFNVSVNDESTSGAHVSVTGLNFVGGIVGRAENSYKIFNATTNLSIVSNFNSSEPSSYEETADRSLHSYAGALVGYASGRGRIVDCTVSGVETVMAARVGIAFGGLGRNATASKIDVVPQGTTLVKAYLYGGLIAGEIRGTLDLATVEGSAGQSYYPFVLKPSVPLSVGGVAGYTDGATISRTQVNQNFNTSAALELDYRQTRKITNVGGVVGYAANTSTTISQVVVNSSIESSCESLGGVVGTVQASVIIDRVAVKGNYTLEGYVGTSHLGGFVGQIERSLSVEINDSYVNSNLTVDTYVYSSTNNAYVGYFVGAGAVSQMARCYATGYIDVELQDRSSLLPVVDVNRTSSTASIVPTHQANDFDNMSESMSGARIKDVYFFGTNKLDDDSGEQTSWNSVNENRSEDNPSPIKFRSNSNISSGATLNLKIIGSGTRQIQDFEGTDTLASYQQDLYSQKALYGIFDLKKLDKVYDERGPIDWSGLGLGSEIYYNALLDRYYLLAHKGSYFAKDEDKGDGLYYLMPDKTYYFNNAREAEADTFAALDDSRGHENITSVWISSHTDLPHLAFENMFSVWKS